MMRYLYLTCLLLASSLAAPGAIAAGPEASQPYGTYPIQHPPVFQRGDKLSKPLGPNNPQVAAFLRFYSKYVLARGAKKLPESLKSVDIVSFPSTNYSYVGVTPRVYGKPLPAKEARFATSSYCVDCHDATVTLKGQNPPMRVKSADGPLYANWSPYGEWSVSLMGLSARDPVFHAQVESERNRHRGVNPTYIDNVCFSCHSPMGQRQLENDLGEGFNHFMIYSTPDNFNPDQAPYNNPSASPKYALYGALARDSVSCGVCHHLGPSNGQWEKDGEVDWSIFYGPLSPDYPVREGDEPGPPYPFTAAFQQNLNRLYVPSEGVSETEEPMLLLGMARAERTPFIKRSEFCGGCHVVIVPKIPVGYKKGGPVVGKPGKTYTGNPFTDPNVALAYEQTTYFEYVNSGFPEKDVQCQTCHMPGLQPPGEKVVSASPAWYTPEYPDVPRRDYKRHRLLGINLFVHEMFQQFYGVLGLADPRRDNLLPPDTAANLLNAEQSIVQHATNGPFGEPTANVKIVSVETKGKTLQVEVKVTNDAGHKFPTGAGFRRGFIELKVLDKNGKVLWISGGTNAFGVILGADGKPLDSEFTKEPKKLQPHYMRITNQDQVQIYEVRTKGEEGWLTTLTLSLFDNVKDNRILPLGWLPANKVGGMKRFGLELLLLANITKAVAVGDDPDYNDPARIGADTLVYAIELGELQGTPASVKAAMRYQTIPPYFLVDRYVDGYEKAIDGFGTATTRLIYLTSRLDTNLDLKSANMSVNDFQVIGDWTMTLAEDQQSIRTKP